MITQIRAFMMSTQAQQCLGQDRARLRSAETMPTRSAGSIAPARKKPFAVTKAADRADTAFVMIQPAVRLARTALMTSRLEISEQLKRSGTP